MTDRVLVTGATGFIGRHLVPALLERGDLVTCLVRRTSDLSGLEKTGVALAYGDVTQPESLKKPLAEVQVVYHLAAVTTARSAAEFQAVNAVGSNNIARACKERASPPTLVVLSSLAAAGPSPAARPRSEADSCSPVSEYGRSKLAGERAARSHAREVPVTIVRAPWVFGERDRDTLKIFRMLRRGLLLIPVASSARYSLIHATDLARFLILAAGQGERCLAASDEQGTGLYYAADDDQLTYAMLGLAIGQAMGVEKPRAIQVPKSVVLALAALLEASASAMRRPPGIVNLDKAKEGFAGSWVCTPEKGKRHLGFIPALPLAHRLRQTATWYRGQGWL